MYKAFKVVTMIGVLMVIVFGIGAYALIGRFNRDAAGIDRRNRERLAEVERIRALPELRGVWVHPGKLKAPFSAKEVAACLLLKSREMHYSGGRGHSTSKLPRFREEDNVAVVHGTDMVLSIDGVAYPFALDSLILSTFDAGDARGGGSIKSSHSHPEEAVRTLNVRSALVAANLDPTLGGRGPDIKLDEILFAPGDTIGFYGRIEAGRIVPLF